MEGLPTEAINPSTLAIDKLSAADIIELMLAEDRKVLAAVQHEKSRIALGVDIIVQAIRKGGRVVFVGAGTSGRLGILESAEMPTTFGTTPELVQAIMAGGRNAFLHAKEGVEDKLRGGARTITRLKPAKKDVVIGVSASGMTPFVRGALTCARKSGAKIIFVTCDPRTELQTFVDLTVSPAVGPEVIAGSTRLKAGTATKLVLNMLTTASMVRIGRTYGNLMVDVPHRVAQTQGPRRRILSGVTGLDYDEATGSSARRAGTSKAAIVMQKTGPEPVEAASRLRKSHDSVREAIGEDVEVRLRELLKLGHPSPRAANPRRQARGNRPRCDPAGAARSIGRPTAALEPALTPGVGLLQSTASMPGMTSRPPLRRARRLISRPADPPAALRFPPLRAAAIDGGRERCARSGSREAA